MSHPREPCECPGKVASDLARCPGKVASHPYVPSRRTKSGIDEEQNAVA
jgi:hypothetical protein